MNKVVVIECFDLSCFCTCFLWLCRYQWPCLCADWGGGRLRPVRLELLPDICVGTPSELRRISAAAGLPVGSCSHHEPVDVPRPLHWRNAENPTTSSTIFASEYSAISGGGGLCGCMHQVPDTASHLQERTIKTLIVTC